MVAASFEGLPGILAEIAEAAGLEAALAIAETVGGTRVDIPKRAIEGHWLTDLVGIEKAEAVCRLFRTLDAEGRERGARHIIIPRGPAGVLAKAKQRLVRDLEAGVSPRRAALKAGLTERTAWRVKARLKDQGSLF